jgi:hypothetical protein
MLIVFLLIGCTVATAGFAAMRDPIHFALFGAFNPQVKGYYQRMVLDRRYRIQLRVLGMVASFFGLMILTAGLEGLLKFKVVHVISEAFLVVLWLSFISAFIFGLVDAVVQVIRGHGTELMFGWYRMWKQSMELGPVAAFPIFMPRMDSEKKVFTAVYGALVVLALVAALVVSTLL